MLDYTRVAFRKILDDFNALVFYLGILTQCLAIAYLVYAIIVGAGVLAANIVLLAVSVAYLTFFIVLSKKEEKKQLKARGKRIFKITKYAVRVYTLGVLAYNFYASSTRLTLLSLVFAAIPFLTFALQIILDLMIEYVKRRSELVTTAVQADVQDVVRPFNAVKNFFSREKEPEEEPTKTRVFLDEQVQKYRAQKEQAKLDFKQAKKDARMMKKEEKKQAKLDKKTEKKRAKALKKASRKKSKRGEIADEEPETVS